MRFCHAVLRRMMKTILNVWFGHISKRVAGAGTQIYFLFFNFVFLKLKLSK
jgi:hypothetical protein